MLCDALLVDTISRSDTYPYVDVREDDVSMGHEATVSKVSEDQLFYLMSRGMTEFEAMAMIVRGFVEPIAKELPMEYALELNRLIELQMEGVGRLTPTAAPSSSRFLDVGKRADRQPWLRLRTFRRGPPPPAQIAVAAESTVATRMSAPPSFDVADFPVPHGREEEWRFTPLERLRGLHDGTAVATGDGVKVDVEAPEGVTVETVGRDDARLGRAGTPVDRVAAQAYSSFEKAACRHRPQGDGAHRADPDRRARRGRGRLRPTRSSSWAPSPRPSSSSTTPVTPCSPPTSTTSSATAPSSPSSPSRTGTTRPCTSPSTTR